MSLTIPLIALGGAAGSVLRYLMVLVNVVGCFAIGVLFVLLARESWQVLLMTGLLGGFTTFSAFSLDTLKLVEAGEHLQAAAYVLGTVALSLIAVALGVAIARSLT